MPRCSFVTVAIIQFIAVFESDWLNHKSVEWHHCRLPGHTSAVLWVSFNVKETETLEFTLCELEWTKQPKREVERLKGQELRLKKELNFMTDSFTMRRTCIVFKVFSLSTPLTWHLAHSAALTAPWKYAATAKWQQKPSFHNPAFKLSAKTTKHFLFT